MQAVYPTSVIHIFVARHSWAFSATGCLYVVFYTLERCVCGKIQEVNICVCKVIICTYVTWNEFRSNRAHFLYIVSSLFFNRIWFVKLCIPIFCDSLACIIANNWVFLPLFATSSQIVAPTASPIFVNFLPPSNTKYVRHQSREWNFFTISWVPQNFEVHLQGFSKSRQGQDVVVQYNWG